jgi:D-aspartate ligase
VSAVSPPAVVVGGEVNAISVVRSLAQAGVEVDVLGPALPHTSLRYSRYPRRYVRFTRKDTIQEDWLAWLEREPPRGAVILPCDDDALELVARHRDRLHDRGLVPVEADDRVVLAMLDKAETYELAVRAGVPAPLTLALDSEDGVAAAAGRLTFPCALKPVHSHLFGRHFGVKAVVVSDEEELRSTYRPMHELGLKVIATEIVLGEGDECRSYYSYLDEQGEPLFHFTKRKPRQFPPRFGLGCFHVTGWDPEVAELGLRFLTGAGVRGLACVEFKRDVRDGELKLIECNHRFTDANELVRRAGLDLAVLVYNRLTGRPTPPLGPARDGLGLWFPLEDVRAFVGYRRMGELTAREWVASLLRPQCFPYFRLDDPLPSAAGTLDFGRRALGKARRELRRRVA